MLTQEQKNDIQNQYSAGNKIGNISVPGVSHGAIYSYLRRVGLIKPKKRKAVLKAIQAHQVKDKESTRGEVRSLGIEYTKTGVTLRVTKTFSVNVVTHE